jgi:hypothetical protein
MHHFPFRFSDLVFVGGHYWRASASGLRAVDCKMKKKEKKKEKKEKEDTTGVRRPGYARLIVKKKKRKKKTEHIHG